VTVTDNVWVVIYRLSKEAISIPCKKTVTAKDMAHMFIAHICRYFGPPESTVSDRGPQFISQFWKEVTRILGAQLTLSTAYHPQTDGQTEIYNQYLEQRLRPFVNHYQNNWSELLPMMDYAQLTLPHDSLGGLSPFEVRNGWTPRTSWDWNTPLTEPRHKLSVEAAKAVMTRMYDAWLTARKQMQAAQAKQKASADKRRRAVNFKKDDYVYLDVRHLPTQRPSRKLDNPLQGPFRVLEQVNHSFRLELPSTMKIHDIFSPDKLRLAARDPLTGQWNPPPEPVNITGEDEWEVQEVIASKKRDRKLFYRVQWLGHDEDLEWYPASDLKYAPHKLRDYHYANPQRDGPPARLMDWLKAWEDGEDDYEELDDDRVMTASSRTSFFRRGG
jgi:hypothetical protein